jgi:hypothetical protein
VPTALEWRGRAADRIEIIQSKHRLAVDPSNSARYQIYPPGQRPDGASYRPEIPDAATLPMLPDPWTDYLTQIRMRRTSRPIDMDSTVDEIYAWADAASNDGTFEVTCAAMRAVPATFGSGRFVPSRLRMTESPGRMGR